MLEVLWLIRIRFPHFKKKMYVLSGMEINTKLTIDYIFSYGSGFLLATLKVIKIITGSSGQC